MWQAYVPWHQPLVGRAPKLHGQPQSQLQAPIIWPFRLQDVPCSVAMSFSIFDIVGIDSSQMDPMDYHPFSVSVPGIDTFCAAWPLKISPISGVDFRRMWYIFTPISGLTFRGRLGMVELYAGQD